MSETTKEQGLRTLKSYPSYKESGVEWLGEIPAHWEVTPLKHMANFMNGFAFKPDEWGLEGTPIIRIENLNGGENFNCTTRNLPAKYRAAKGDLLFGWSGNRGTSFGPFLWWRDGTHYVNQHIFRVVDFAVDKTWMYWALRGVTFYVEKQAHGIIGMVHVTRGELGSIPIPALPHQEQEQIAAFLKREHARIDGLVAKKERLIELLQERRAALITRAVTKGLDPTVPMRNSGVEWLDEYPAHWTGLPLKRWVATKITDGPHETPEFVTEGVDFISAEAVSDRRIDFDKRRGYISPELHAYYCRKCKPVRHDLLLCKSGATTGKLARVDVDFEFSVWSPLALVRAKRSLILPRFLEMALRSEYVQKQIRRTWSAGTQPNISMGDLEQLFVVAPETEEQAEILGYVDQEAGGFDLLCTRVRKAVDCLKELRIALISAAVTGKIDVRDEIV